MFVSNPYLTVTLTGCSWSNVYAVNQGGFIDGDQIAGFSISACPSMSNIKAGVKGSFIASSQSGLAFSMSTCTFNCDISLTTLATLPSMSATQGSLIDLTSGGAIISSTNSFSNCHTASQGSIFHLTSCTSFADTSSSYTNNAALSGGALYIDSTNADLTTSTFTNNWGQTGGTLYLNGQLILKMIDAKVVSSSATGKGGLLYAYEPGTQALNI